MSQKSTKLHDFAKNYAFVQNNVKISSRQNVLNFLFFGASSFSGKPKLGLKVQLKVQNIDLKYNTYKHRKLMAKGMLTIKYENLT